MTNFHQVQTIKSLTAFVVVQWSICLPSTSTIRVRIPLKSTVVRKMLPKTIVNALRTLDVIL